MSGELDAFAQLLTGRAIVTFDQVDGAQEGRVLSVDTGAGKAVITLKGFASDRRFGPMPYGRTDTPPEVGDVCLAIFVGKGVDRGWLISWREAD